MATDRITRAEAERLLELANEARWPLPSSSGSPLASGGHPGAAIERLVEQQQRLPVAARFLIESGDREAALQLAAGVWRMWMISGDVAGGREFLAPILERAGTAPSRAAALALYGDGLLAFRQGDVDGSRARNEAALEASRATGDAEALALAYAGLSRVALEEGDAPRARDLARSARDSARGLAAAMEQGPLHLEAQAARSAGDYAAAAALFRESLALNRRNGDLAMVQVELHNLGHVECHRGNVDAAEDCFAECARIASPDDPYSVAMRDLNQAVVALARGDLARSSTLLRRIDALLAESGTRLAVDDRFELDDLRARLAAATRGGRDPG